MHSLSRWLTLSYCQNKSILHLSFELGVKGIWNLPKFWKPHTAWSYKTAAPRIVIKIFPIAHHLKPCAPILWPPSIDVAAMTSCKNNLFIRKFISIDRQSNWQRCILFFSPDVIFSTAHKAEGLEFDHVRVGEDFLSGFDSGINLSELTTCSTCACFLAANLVLQSPRKG